MKERISLITPDPSVLDVPFKFIKNTNNLMEDAYPNSYYNYSECTYSNIIRRLVTQSNTPTTIFPLDIERYIWIYYDDSEYMYTLWYVLCVLSDNRYAFYKAECDSSGFTRHAKMKLCISDNLDDIITYGMGDTARDLYYSETKESEN